MDNPNQADTQLTWKKWGWQLANEDIVELWTKITKEWWRYSRIVNENYKRIMGDYDDYEQWLIVREYSKIMEAWMEKLGAWLEVLLMPPSLWEHESKLPTNLLEERVTMFKSRAKKFCLRGNLKTIF